MPEARVPEHAEGGDTGNDLRDDGKTVFRPEEAYIIYVRVLVNTS